MAEDVKIRLIVDGDEVVATVKNVDEGLDDLVKSGEDVEDTLKETGAAGKEAMEDVEQATEDATGATKKQAAAQEDSAAAARDNEQAMRRTSDAAEDMDSSMRRASGSGTQAAQALSGIAADAPFGVIGVANNFEQLTASVAEADGGIKAVGASLLSWGNIATITVGVLSGLAAAYGDDLAGALFGASEQADELTDRIKNLKGVTESVLDITQDAPQYEIASIQAGEQALDQLETRLEKQQTEIEQARELQGLREQVDKDTRSLAQQDIPERDITTSETAGELGTDTPALTANRIQSARSRLQRLQELERQFEGRDVSELVDQGQRRKDVLKGQIEALEALIQAEKDLQAQRNLGDLQAVQEVTDDEDERASSRAPAPPVVEPANRTLDQEQVDFSRELVLFQELRTQLERINAKPFLPEAEKGEARVQAVVSEIRRLQGMGALLSRDSINSMLRSLDLTEQEAEQVREALKGVETQAKELPRLRLGQALDVSRMGIDQIAEDFDVTTQQAKQLKSEAEVLRDQFENQLASAAGQFGASMVQALDDGKISAQELFSSLTQVASTLLTTFGGPAGAALGPIVGSLGGLFDTGGYTGAMPEDAPAGIVHGQEYVFSADATKGNVRLLEGLHQALQGGSVSIPGYDMGGYVATSSPPVSVSTSGGGASQQAVQQAADEAARRTADRVADALAERPNIIRVGPRGARDVVETGQEYSQRKSTRPSS